MLPEHLRLAPASPSRRCCAGRLAGGALLLGLLAGAEPGAAQLDTPHPALRGLVAEPVVTGVAGVTDVVHAGDERLFLARRNGAILVYEAGALRDEPFLDLTDRVDPDHPVGLAFHPRWRESGFLYVYYSHDDGRWLLSRFDLAADGASADPASEKRLLAIAIRTAGHRGGQLRFGPDGYLYLSLGDAGGVDDPLCMAQDPSTLPGSLLRLDVDRGADRPPYHSIPFDNPFVDDPTRRGEIWDYGFRNLYRFDFDAATGDLYLADVGQGEREEIDLHPADTPGGLNFGWKSLEGNLCRDDLAGSCPYPLPACDDPALTPPIHDYVREFGRCAIIGGVVYRGGEMAEVAGDYLYADFCSGEVWAGRQDGEGWQRRRLDMTRRHVLAFGTDVDGEVYFTDDTTLYRLTSRGEVTLATLDVEATEGDVALIQAVRSGDGGGALEVAYRTVDGSATAGDDYVETTGTLTWDDGEVGERTIAVPLVDDSTQEPLESFVVELLPGDPGETGAPRQATVTVVDDDEAEPPPPPPACTAGPKQLCLLDDRFAVRVEFRESGGDWRLATASELTGDTGTFWYFSPANIELVVKVLDGCAVPGFDGYWVFAAGLTNVQTRLRVTDTSSGETFTHVSEQGQPFLPLQATDALPCD